MKRLSPLAREAVGAALASAAIAALFCWAGRPGSDFAAHAYQLEVFRAHGFEVWNNYWYAGRYGFVTYSLLYYPLAWVFGIRLLAVLSIGVAAAAFALVVGRRWGGVARWSGRAFAVVWAGLVLPASFPFALGAAFALLGILALQSKRRGLFALLALLTLAASPLAFLLLAVVLAGFRFDRKVAIVLAVLAAAELLLYRIFPDDGRYPFPAWRLLAALAFCAVAGALGLRRLFGVYGVLCLLAFAIPSSLGENVTRLRYAAIPLAVLVLSLRRWRPWPVAVALLAFAGWWNLSPLEGGFAISRDPAASAAIWRPALDYLRLNLTPSYRVEAVDTEGHWAAYYLARAGIRMTRGWFRQDDFPQNALLYHRLEPDAYLAWLRRLGVRYVVLTPGPHDYSARGEAQLVPKLLHRVADTVYEVPAAQPIAPRVLSLGQSALVVSLPRAGAHPIAVRYSPYWVVSHGCVSKTSDGMTLLDVTRPGQVTMQIELGADAAWNAFLGSGARRCAR